MTNLNVNGRTVDPRSVRQIPVPAGETPKSYVEKNKGLIEKNFRDELYFEHDNQLFVTEDQFVVEHLGSRNTKDAKLRVGTVPAVALLIDNEPDAHKITEIKIEGAGKHQSWIKDKLKVETGARINLHDLQREADRLFDSGRFLSVDFAPSATDKGVSLTLNVVEIPEKIRFQGLPAAQSQALDKLFPRPLNQQNISKGMQAIEAELQKDNQFLLRGLDYQFSGENLDLMVSRAEVPTQLTINGPETESTQIASFFTKPYSHESIEKGMDALRAHYQQEGKIVPRLDFQVKGSELTVDYATAPMPTQTQFEGLSVYTADEVKALFKQPLTMENIQKGLEALQQKYTDDGYLLMPPEGVAADLSQGKLTVLVREARLSEVVMSGNDRTQQEVFQREMRTQPNQPVNIKTLDEDLKRISGTGLFANLQHNVEPDPSNPDKVRIRVHASEEKASSMNVGAGYSMSNGPFGTASLNMGNVKGMNRRFSADVTLGTKVWGGGVSYYDPWAFKDRTSLGASVYHRQWKGPYSDEVRTGAKVTVGKPLGDIYNSPWRIDLTADAQRIGIDKQYSVSGTGVDLRTSLRPTLSYNTLDNPILPHKGTKFTAAIEPTLVSGRLLGKMDARVDHYKPLGERFTLHGALQGGTILGNAPIYEKYNNAGSGGTLLGWDSDGSRLGSNYAVGSVGLNAEIWGPVSATARVTAGDYFEGTAIRPKVGAGVGVNVKIGSMGVLNAGYGFKLVGKEKGDDAGAFHIGFGIPF